MSYRDRVDAPGPKKMVALDGAVRSDPGWHRGPTEVLVAPRSSEWSPTERRSRWSATTSASLRARATWRSPTRSAAQRVNSRRVPAGR